MNDRGRYLRASPPVRRGAAQHGAPLQRDESSAVREELAVHQQPLCATCEGTRLRREARHVFVENTALLTISDMSIGHAMDFFNLKLSGQRAKIAEKVLKETWRPSEIPVNVGLNYLTLSCPQRRCPAVKPSVSVWPARLAGPWVCHVCPRRTVHRPAPARQ